MLAESGGGSPLARTKLSAAPMSIEGDGGWQKQPAANPAHAAHAHRRLRAASAVAHRWVSNLLYFPEAISRIFLSPSKTGCISTLQEEKCCSPSSQE